MFPTLQNSNSQCCFECYTFDYVTIYSNSLYRYKDSYYKTKTQAIYQCLILKLKKDQKTSNILKKLIKQIKK